MRPGDGADHRAISSIVPVPACLNLDEARLSSGPHGRCRVPRAPHARPDRRDHRGHCHRRVLLAQTNRGARDGYRGERRERPRREAPSDGRDLHGKARVRPDPQRRCRGLQLRGRGGLRLLRDVLLFPLLPHATTRHFERQRLGGLAPVDEERLPVREAREVLEGSRDASVGRPGLPGLRQRGNPGKPLALRWLGPRGCAQSRPLVVHTSTRLPSASESVHQEGAYLSVTRWPPAAIADATRPSPCSGGTQTSMYIRGSGASNFWNQIGVPRLCGSTTSSGLSARSWYPRTARQNGFTLGMSCASTASWTVLTTDGSAGRLSLRATAEICRANSTSRSVIPM